ncbi:MAG: DUF998 domain-containing protein, partial [Planctomycetota bacterium]
MNKRIRILTAACGLLSVTVFACSFTVLGILHPDFNVFSDFISKLGTGGQPQAIYWNVLGFAVVGLLLAAFGWLFGLCKEDRILGTCLMIAGLGYAFAATPTDFTNADSPFSKVHFVSVCLSLAGYSFGLARLTGSQSTDFDKTAAKIVVTLSILPIICVSGGVSAEPIAHRIILTVVFAWV